MFQKRQVQARLHVDNVLPADGVDVAELAVAAGV